MRVLLLPLGVALAGAGLSGALPTRAATLVALGLVAVAGVCAGSAGRTVEARVTGWLGATAALFGFAFTVGRAAGLPLASSAFGVAGAAAAVLVLGTVLALRRRVDEGRAVQAAAHAGAVVALLLTTVGRARRGHRAVWGLRSGSGRWPRGSQPGRAGTRRDRGRCELLAWWLLSPARLTVEVYSLPAAGRLLAGWRRAGPAGDRSWVATAGARRALLPTWPSCLPPGETMAAAAAGRRRARHHVRAPAPAGPGRRRRDGPARGRAARTGPGLGPAAAVAPLAVGGLILVGLAITFERRRRDVARIRDALARMT